MVMKRWDKYWVLIILFLVLAIACGGALFASRYSQSQPVEILLSPSPAGHQLQGEVYIGGVVTNPGFYPFSGDDSISDLVQAGGGITTSADLTRFELYVTPIGESPLPQKVDINRAEGWLLQALPGIGEVRSQAIIDYRTQNGPFSNINELKKVSGIGDSIYEKIEGMITVAE